MKEKVLKTLAVIGLIIFLLIIPIFASWLVTYVENKNTLSFINSPRYNYMSKESLIVAERFCGGEGMWSQIGYNNDHEHVGIICDDDSEVEIRIISDLSDKREDK